MSKQTAAAAKVRAEMKLSGGEPAGVVAHREALVIRPLPELSILPAPQKAENK